MKKPEKIQLLLIEDNPADARLLLELFKDIGNMQFEITVKDRISSTVDFLRVNEVHVILLDLSLPDSSGINTVEQIYTASPKTPIIVLTGLEDDELALKAVQMGAQDYLVKGGLDSQRFSRVILFAIERKRAELRLQHLATHDALTHLPNRTLFQDRLLQAIERCRRGNGLDQENSNWQVAVVMLDLDGFKAINDTLGHDVGDLLLQAISQRMRNKLRRVDTIARFGGDEFILIFENLSKETDAQTIGEKIKSFFSTPFQIGKEKLTITASIGISLYPQDGTEPEILLKHADIAMYAAKEKRNGYSFFNQTLKME